MPASQIYEYVTDPPLTDAQIKALPTGDFTLVAGIPGKIIKVVSASLTLDTLAGAYTNVTAASAGLLYNGDDASSYFLTDEFSQVGLQTITLIGPSYPGAGGSRLDGRWADVSLLLGAPLQLSVGNADGAFTGGHVDNSLTVNVHYLLENG